MIIILASFLSLTANASCFVVSDLKGMSSRQAGDFKIDNDGISAQKFLIELKGEDSRVSPNNMRCFQAGASTLLCAATGSKGESTVETWSLYPERKTVVYTKSINGYGPLNGANLFVGKIKARCD
ncbi:putative lipoprotein [Photobacterium leiognathi subsp. mandapamensis svers.1.1.]|nr:putative lipoprotein [Photobacterium leiognathi subsp. mandapamensis svers.1.1.]